MPPTPSGIADYNRRLLPVLADRAEVDLFTPGAAPPHEVHRNLRWLPPRALKETCSPWAYDALVYTVGNSDDHHDLYDLAQEFPGLLWMHDARLPGLLVTYARGRLGDRWREFLRDRLLRQYRRRLPLHVRDDVDRTPGHLNEFGLGMTKELVDVARGVVVSSSLAARLVALDQQPDAKTPRTWVLPLAVPDPWDGGVDRASGTIVSLGMVSPIKGTELLISAVAALPPEVTLTFVGHAEPEVREEVQRHIDAVGVGDRVRVTGHVADDEYRRWLSSATVAVQLRHATNGESSAAVTDALAAGLPVVTNVHAATELPEGTVSLVPWDVDPAALARHLGQLLADPDELERLAAAGHAYAASWGFPQVADELLRIVRELQH